MTPPEEPQSQDTATELLVARRFLLEGAESVATSDQIAIRRGLLLADLASEAILKVVLRSLDVDVEENLKVAELVGRARAAAKAQRRLDLPYLSEPIRRLRKLRNLVMHDGLAQEADSSRRAVASARKALNRLVADILALDLDNLRLTEFVRSPWLRWILEQAEDEYGAGEFGKSAALSRRAMDVLMGIWRKFISDMFNLKEDLTAQIIGTVSSGAYLPDLKRLLEATAGATALVSVSGKVSYNFTKTRWTGRSVGLKEAEDAKFALDFVGGLALQIEARFTGDPPRPFAGNPPKSSRRTARPEV
jgi:hypothetical protein